MNIGNLGAFARPPMHSIVNVINQRAEDQNRSTQGSIAQKMIAAKQVVPISDQTDQDESVNAAADANLAAHMTQNAENHTFNQEHAAKQALEMLHRTADMLDLADRYEKVLSGYEGKIASSLDEFLALSKDQHAYDYYKSWTSQEALETQLNTLANYVANQMYGSAGDVASKATSLEYLGLENWDSMSTSEKKDALINAINTVNSLLGTQMAYQSKSDGDLTRLDRNLSNNYSSGYMLHADVSKATFGPAISLEELANDPSALDRYERPAFDPDVYDFISTGPSTQVKYYMLALHHQQTHDSKGNVVDRQA